MRLAPAKYHVDGKYDLAISVRTRDGAEMEFRTKASLGEDHPAVKHAREALAALLHVEVEDIP